MNSGYSKINFEAVKEVMDSGKNYVLIDVRTEDEYCAVHADGAKLLPVDDITAETAAKIAPDKTAIIMMYCKSGMRSRRAAEMFVKLGYKDVRNIGSLAGWPYKKDYGMPLD